MTDQYCQGMLQEKESGGKGGPQCNIMGGSIEHEYMEGVLQKSTFAFGFGFALHDTIPYHSTFHEENTYFS